MYNISDIRARPAGFLFLLFSSIGLRVPHPFSVQTNCFKELGLEERVNVATPLGSLSSLVPTTPPSGGPMVFKVHGYIMYI